MTTAAPHDPKALQDLLARVEAPKCRVCQGTVAVWRTEHPEQAICMDCCGTAEHPDGETGHQYEYERGEGWMCRYCAALPPNDWYAFEE